MLNLYAGVRAPSGIIYQQIIPHFELHKPAQDRLRGGYRKPLEVAYGFTLFSWECVIGDQHAKICARRMDPFPEPIAGVVS